MSKRLAVTVVVPTKNEERAIADCLSKLVPCFSQVVVVDSNSEDTTCALAVAHGAEVVNFTWNGKYPKKKQWCLDNIAFANDWVLFIDADELVSAELVEEIQSLLMRDFDGVSAYDVQLSYAWQGHILRYGQKVTKRALLKRDRTAFPPLPDLDASGMGEQEGHYQPRTSGSIARLSSPLLHFDPDPVGDWFSRHNRYSDWEAYLRQNDDARAAVRALRSKQGATLDRLPAKPIIIFLYNYVLKQGFRDGRPGFDYALALSFYHWQIGVKVRDLRPR